MATIREEPRTSGPVQRDNDDVAYTLNERRRIALQEVDTAEFSRFHVKVALVAGVGFLTDSYDIFAINIAATMIGYVYSKQYTLSDNQDLGIKVATPVGTFVGQLFFGWLADRVGRKRMYGVELIIIIVATFAQVLTGQAKAVSFIGALVVWRFIMGVGIGGDYPLSAVISSEFASTRIRGRLMTAVFAFQGWGNFLASLVGLIVVTAFKSQLLKHDAPDDLVSVDHMWRLLIGLGCVPCVIALYFRLTIPETPRYTMDIERNVQQALKDVDAFLTKGSHYLDPDAVIQHDAPRATRADFVAYFSKWENFKVLFGCAWSWFALDVAYYGLGLNSSIVLQAIGFANNSSHIKDIEDKAEKLSSIYSSLHNICVGNLILSVAGLIPGYWATFLFIDKWGRRPIQFMGFVLLTILLCCMGFGYDKLVKLKSHPEQGQSREDNASDVYTTNGPWFVILYCLVNFFQNFGPNTTTFIIPGEAFPTRYRSTSHGISAASGKLGAIIAQVGFSRLKNIGGKDRFIKHILEIFAFFMLSGIFSTLLIPETNGRSLEILSNENQKDFVREPSRQDENPATTVHSHYIPLR